MDPQIGRSPENSNPESEESETPAALHPPEMDAGSEARPFPCPHCPMTYRLEKHLNVHLKVHCADHPHVCPLCGKVWVDLFNLKRHMRSHTGEKLFKCSADGCGKEYTRRQALESHMQIHTGEKITCAFCGRSFTNITSLKVHNWKFHNPQAKQRPCGTCGKVYVSLQELKRHLETHVPDDPQECPICGKSCRNGLVLKKHMQRHSLEGTYQCEHCLKNFTKKIGLQTHIKTVHTSREHKAFQEPSILTRHKLAIHPEEQREEDTHTPTHTQEDGQEPLHIPSENKQGLINISAKLNLQVEPADAKPKSQKSKTFVALQPPEMVTASEARPFLCPQCPKTYRLKKYLKEHMKVHSPDNPHVCPFCNKVLLNDNQLTAHIRSHTGERLFKCSVDGCGKEFARRRNMEIHMQIHTEEKTVSKPTCAICEKSFIDIQGLKTHNWKFHNAQKKKHPCVTCGNVYISLPDLKRHLGTHLPDDPQNCPTCGKSCRNGLALKEHVQRHGREGTYKCEHCAKNFQNNSYLKKHIRAVHGSRKGGDKPFKCPTCSKAFTTQKLLQVHIKVHTGEKVAECQFCGRRFALPASLAMHLRTHTGDSTHTQADGVVPVDPLHISLKNNPGNDPPTEVPESNSQLYLRKGFHLRQLTVPVQRMKFKNVGGEGLELRSGGECWYVCSKCGRGSKSILVRSHALQCEVHQSNKPNTETG